MVGDLLLLWYPVYQSAEYGRCTCEFFKKYVSNKGLKTALHAQDLVKFCHTLQTGLYIQVA